MWRRKSRRSRLGRRRRAFLLLYTRIHIHLPVEAGDTTSTKSHPIRLSDSKGSRGAHGHRATLDAGALARWNCRTHQIPPYDTPYDIRAPSWNASGIRAENRGCPRSSGTAGRGPAPCFPEAGPASRRHRPDRPRTVRPTPASSGAQTVPGSPSSARPSRSEPLGPG